MINPIDSDVHTLVDASSAGLWGLVIKALLQEGKTSALATMAAVSEGRAFVQIEVLFTKRGMALEGKLCSHGERGHLFSATLNNPEPPTTPAAFH